MITFAAYVTFSDGLTILVGRFENRTDADTAIADYIKNRPSYNISRTQVVKVPTYFFFR